MNILNKTMPNFIIIYLIVLLVSCLVSQPSIKCNDIDDFEKLKNRTLAPFFKRKLDSKKVKQSLASLKADGSWKDVDYKNASRNIWKTTSHLSRVLNLVLAYKGSKSSFKGKKSVKAKILKSLDYWLRNDFQNKNWWWNVIDVPKRMSLIGMAFGNDLPDIQKKKMISIIKRSDLKGNPSILTGQNLVWIARNNIYRGIMEKNVKATQHAISKISNEIKISTKEGIQHDYSFHQHGPLLFNHGYGANFAVDCTHLIKLTHSTQFALSKKKEQILTKYILDGSQWMIYGNTLDYGAKGRSITRPNKTAKYLSRAAENLITIKAERSDELKKLVLRIEDKSSSPLIGNRFFWRSDFMVHHRGTYYTSTRMHSKRTLRTDGAYNGEGKKIQHIADGCNFLMVTGDEYLDIYPLWDWKKIPGTTIEQDNNYKSKTNIYGQRNFVGGVSDGTFGMSFFNLQYLKLSAHKSWFFFDNEYVCLGSGITCSSENNIVTTINQCFLKGKTTVFNSRSKRVLAKSNHKLKDVNAIHHNNVAYIINLPGNISLKNNAQKGSWRSVSDSQSKKEITNDIFKLYIEHGAKPTDKKYSYTVVPNIKVNGVKAYISKGNIKILKNTKGIQAVMSKSLKLTQIAFFKPGVLKIDSNLSVTVDQMCLLMIQRVENKIKLSLSDPKQKLKGINIRISGAFTGKGAKYNDATKETLVTINLPNGPYAGKSVVCWLNKK
ncbi:MAG: hypothetical protein COA79_07225 [Planctomycetota bacterium]|nr:MAG: hypothetical protein COA79_07225 [Planctomycetota bacterium]